MTLRTLTKFVLVLSFVGTATATPCAQNANVFPKNEAVHNLSPCATNALIMDGEKTSISPLSRAKRSHHKVAESSTTSADYTHGRSDSLAALQETAKLVKLAAMLPVETLKVLRMITVPLVNTTLALPANLLEGVARISVGKEIGQEAKEQSNFPGGTVKSIDKEPAEKSSDKDAQGPKARSLGGSLSGILALLKAKHQKSFFLHKKLTLGPFRLTKVLSFGKFDGEATTPPPEVVHAATTPAPEVIQANTAPLQEDVHATTTPAPRAVPDTTCPPKAVIPLSTPPPSAEVPEVTGATIPVAIPPATVSVAPVVTGPAPAVVVTAPQQPIVENTNQVAIVQHAPPAPGTSGQEAVAIVNTPTPPARIPATIPPPVAETTIPSIPVEAPPAPVSVAPIVTGQASAVVVTPPQQPIVESTNQVAIVQDSPPFPVTAGQGAVSIVNTPSTQVIVPATTTLTVAQTTTPASPIAAPPALVSVGPVVSGPAPVVVVAPPQQPIVESTNQVAIVQNAPAVPDLSGQTAVAIVNTPSPLAEIPLTTPTPSADVSTTTLLPVAETTTPASPAAAPPALVSVGPVASGPAPVVVVTPPQPPIVQNTNQVAIVQNSTPVAITSRQGASAIVSTQSPLAAIPLTTPAPSADVPATTPPPVAETTTPAIPAVVVTPPPKSF